MNEQRSHTRNASASAFPSEQSAFNQDANGLTKREYLAALVMQGLYANSGLPAPSAKDDYTSDRGFTSRLRRAEEAVKAADALLAALAFSTDDGVTP